MTKQDTDIDSSDLNPGVTVWLTGLPSAGKTTLGMALAQRLKIARIDCQVLDGDEVRTYLCSDLGFSRRDRDENVRRIGYVASLLSAHGVVAICPVISPYREMRDKVRELHRGRFMEVHVATPIEVCEDRDVKGLYAKARAGDLKHMTGIDDPYEPPLNPELVVHTQDLTLEQAVAQIWEALENQIPAGETISNPGY